MSTASEASYEMVLEPGNLGIGPFGYNPDHLGREIEAYLEGEAG